MSSNQHRNASKATPAAPSSKPASSSSPAWPRCSLTAKERARRTATSRGAAERRAAAREALQGKLSDTLEPGTQVAGRWRIERRLGLGGMAAVYLATGLQSGGPIAIKILHRVLTCMSDLVQGFLAEARAVAGIDDPHVVRVTDYGQLDDGRPYMVMDYVPGEDLAACLEREGALAWPKARRIALQICEGLQAVHDAGLVHCDVKPKNCLYVERPDGQMQTQIIDFGIARPVDLLPRGPTDQEPMMGTPEYMAPEQARGGIIGPRTDVYALGVTLFTLLTGRPPFEAEHASHLMAAHLRESPPAPSELRPGLDPRIDAVVLRAMAKDPEQRFGSMRAMAEAIEAIEPDAAAPPYHPPHGAGEASDTARFAS